MSTRDPGDAESETGLDQMRAELDVLDERLLDVVRERLAVCTRIARHKSAHGVPMMQPHRIGVVHARAARYGHTHGIDEDFLRRLYELVIEETCRIEDLVMSRTTAR